MKLVRLAAMMLFTLVCLVGFGPLQPAQAEEDPTYTWEYGITCYSFGGDQAAAQQYYEENGHPADFDLNGNGIACEDESDGDFTAHPTAGPDPTCGTWMDDQASAQEYYDNHGFPVELDLNGNGIACDSPEDGDFSPWPPTDESGSSNGPTAWPEYTCYTFPDGWDAAIDYYNTNGGPATLDADGDGIPCEPNGDDEVTECRDLGGPQSIAQEYYESHGMPRNLDLDQDGLACMNEADGYWGDTAPRPASLPNEEEEDVEDEPVDEDVDAGEASSDEDEAAADEESAPAADDAESEADDNDSETSAGGAAVTSLPSTGSGSDAGSSMPMLMLAGGALLMLIAAASILRRSHQTA